MNTFKIIAGVLIVGALLSCDILIVPQMDRWNPADPDNTLVSVDKYIYPTIDGYIDDAGSSFFADPILHVRYSAPMASTLIRFDYSELPTFLETATLELYCNATTSNDVSINRIIEDWSIATVAWPQISAGSFIDPSMSITVNIDVPGKLFTFDTTNMVKADLAQRAIVDFLIRIAATMNCEFHSSRNTNRPRLHVTGHSLP